MRHSEVFLTQTPPMSGPYAYCVYIYHIDGFILLYYYSLRRPYRCTFRVAMGTMSYYRLRRFLDCTWVNGKSGYKAAYDDGLVKFADTRATTIAAFGRRSGGYYYTDVRRTSAAVAVVHHSLKRVVSRGGGLKITSGPAPRRRARETQR